MNNGFPRRGGGNMTERECHLNVNGHTYNNYYCGVPYAAPIRAATRPPCPPARIPSNLSRISFSSNCGFHNKLGALI